MATNACFIYDCIVFPSAVSASCSGEEEPKAAHPVPQLKKTREKAQTTSFIH